MINKVYVLCTPYYKTGGTELLHQLVYTINSLGGDASIVYYDATPEKNINPAFAIYTSEYLDVSEIVDSDENILVLPEILTYYFPKFKNIKKYMWWESVDSYLLRTSPLFCFKQGFYKATLKAFLNNVGIGKYKHISKRNLKDFDCHLCQSQYAIDFLEKINITNFRYLSDYINEMYTETSKSVSPNMKQNIVCYNPQKGVEFTKNLINCAKNIEFVPIKNMTNKEVMELLARSKVYIDFGEHPGKDRVPREAASMGCCVITGKKGSAKFHEDIPIDTLYKFNDDPQNYKKIIELINDIFTDFNTHYMRFNGYRSFIDGEKDKFFSDVENIFEIKRINE